MSPRRKRLGLLAVLAALAALALTPSAGAVHVDSEVVFEETYVVAGAKTERDRFGTGLPPSDKPLLCYRRVLDPGPFGAWSASLFDGDDDLAIQDVAAWSRVGPDATPQKAFLVKERVKPGGWTIDVRGSGFGTAHVTVAWTETLQDCRHR